MRELNLTIVGDGIALPATLTRPPGAVRAGVVALHGATQPSRDWLLYRHLAQLLPSTGIGVLRFDRRPATQDVPFGTQATDALGALAVLGAHLGPVPLGLWAFSQGTWAAAVAAARSPQVAFLLLVGSPGMSPAAQMRYGCARQLTAAGYGGEELALLARLREAYEQFQRGMLPRATAQAIVDAAATRPWFPLVYVPRELGEPGRWVDMDFDPTPIFARVRCPVLLCYGADDEWVPIAPSIRAWQQSSPSLDLTILRIPDTQHLPVLHAGESSEAASPVYAEGLRAWLRQRFG